MDIAQGWWFGPFHLDLRMAVLERRSESVELRPKDLALLRYLIENTGRVLSRDEILEAVWPETFVTDDVLRGGVARLRRALEDDVKTPRYIATVPRRGYRWLAPASTEPPVMPESAAVEAVPVGREEVIRQLRKRLEEALGGSRQLVLLTGAAGLGKTTVVEAFLAAAASMTAAPRTTVGQCIEQYGTGEAYLPFLEAIGRLCRRADGSDVVALLRRRAPTWLVQMPWLLDDEDRAALQHELQGTTRERMLREMAEALEALSVHRPLILVLEDLHWSDHATLDLLALLAQRREPARLLLLSTFRPEETSSATRPLRGLVQMVRRHSRCLEVPLNLLSADQVAAYLESRFRDHRFPSWLAENLHGTTEGQPLFLVTLVESLLERGRIAQRRGAWSFHGEVGDLAAIPETLRQMIFYQLEQASEEEQEALEAASVAGVDFSASTVAAGLSSVDPVAIESLCESMARRGGVVERRDSEDGEETTRYGFRHALHREVAYGRIPAARRRLLHRRLAEHLESVRGDDVEGFAGELAIHWQQAGDPQRAVHWRRQAARSSRRRHAYREAVAHLSTAAQLLESLPESPERSREELAVRIALGAALLNGEGPAGDEVVTEYSRAWDLCSELDDTDSLGRVLYALWVARSARVEHRRAREIGEELLELGRRTAEPSRQLVARQVLGTTCWWTGEFVDARQHLDEASRIGAGIPASAGPEDLIARISSDSYGALALCILGFLDQAREQGEEALRQARDLAHPHTLAPTLMLAASLYLYCRQSRRGRELAEELVALASKYGFAHWRAGGLSLGGWALAQQGDLEKGLARQRKGVEKWRRLGIDTAVTSLLAQHAEVLWWAGRGDDFEAVVTEVKALAETTGEFPWEAELYRVEGEWRRTVARDDVAAEECIQRALKVARGQQAKLWELRAATSLARLWHQRGEDAEARKLLATAHGWFTEGFDLPDLQEATDLLEEIR